MTPASQSFSSQSLSGQSVDNQSVDSQSVDNQRVPNDGQAEDARLPLTAGTTFGPTPVQVTRATLVRYAGASGDFNPIHFSEAQARALGLEGVIAHGMWTMGQALSTVIDWLLTTGRSGDDVVSYFVRFTRPVVVPDGAEGVTVTVAGTVVSATDDLVTVALEVSCVDGEGGQQTVLGAAKVEVRA